MSDITPEQPQPNPDPLAADATTTADVPTYPAPAPSPAPAVATADTDPVSEPAPAPSTPAADVGDVISYQTDPDDETTITRGLVVGTVEGAEHRDEGLLVVPLPDAFVIPLDAVKD